MLQRRHFKILISEQSSLYDFFSLLIGCPDIDDILLVVAGVLQALVGAFYHGEGGFLGKWKEFNYYFNGHRINYIKN